MDIRALTRLVGYHHWATSRLLGALSALPADALDRPVGGSFGTLRGLLQHILGTEEVWLERLRGHSPSALPDLTSFNAVSDFQAAWGAVQTEQHIFISGLGSEQFEAPISYINFRGEAWAYPLDAVLLHLVNHGTYHRGQLAHVLRQLGQTAPATDYLVFVDENLNTVDEPMRG
ncbi:MAG TPA: DinB family protein [Longimicrobiales bacterium]|nr:DinB family protein [Longimicrobiales bacterium]